MFKEWRYNSKVKVRKPLNDVRRKGKGRKRRRTEGNGKEKKKTKAIA